MATRSPSISRALSASLRGAEFQSVDKGAVALAKRYAALIDTAQESAEELERLRPEDEDQAAVIARLRSRVEAQTVASDLGPKLLAALAALGMTPAARKSAGPGKEGDPGERRDPLVELRARAAARRSR